MNRFVRIEVTAEDISKGEVANCERCPIARAICRATGLRPSDVGVVGSHVSLYVKHIRYCDRLVLPLAAADFILKFDDHDDCEPFAFDLEVPDGLPAVTP